MTSRIEADYVVETPVDPNRAAEVMAGEQSSGTFVKVPGETPELHERSAAQVEALEVIGTVDTPSLPGGATGASYTRAKVTLSWPLDNVGPDLPNLMATIGGNLFELNQFSGLRVLDLRLPDAFARAYPGPKLGIAGTRALSGVDTGPLIGTIIKPSVGFTADQTANLVETLAKAGIDFIKDDELQADGRTCPFEDRARAIMRVINDHADRTGKKVMYAFNLTGEVDQMRRRHDLVRDLGGTCVMVSLNCVGLGGFLGLSRHSDLPIHAHRNGWGYLSRAPLLGWDYAAWSKFWRLAGAFSAARSILPTAWASMSCSPLASSLSRLVRWSRSMSLRIRVSSSARIWNGSLLISGPPSPPPRPVPPSVRPVPSDRPRG